MSPTLAATVIFLLLTTATQVTYPNTTKLLRLAITSSLLQISCKQKRSIELNTAYSKIGDTKLPRHILPSSYQLELHPKPEIGVYTGRVTINLTWHEPTYKVVLHCDKQVKIANTITAYQTKPDDETAEK